MKRTFKRSLALVLSVLMILTAAPLAFASGDKVYAICNSSKCNGAERELVFIGTATPATCTESGYSSIGYACKACGEGVAHGGVPAAVKEEAPGHELEYVEAQAPTCLDNGVKAHLTCKVCHNNLALTDNAFSTNYLTDADLVDAAAGSHSFDEYDPATLDPAIPQADYLKSAATCTAKAVYYQKCTVCGEFSTEKFFEWAGDPAPSHVWDEGVVTVEPTCKDGGKDGTKLFTCTVEGCGATREEVIPKPDGHTAPPAGEWTFEAGKDCTTGGKAYRYCTECGDILEESTFAPGQHETTGGTVPPLEPTCTEAGHTAGLKCVVCGAYVLAPETINAKGHTMTRHEEEESSCVKNGNDEYYDCSVCEKYFLDADGTTETTLADVTRNLKAHTPAQVEELKATCTEDGHAAGFQCSVCGELLDTEKYNKLGHTMEAKTVSEATCTEDGYKVDCYRCVTCKECFEDIDGEKPIAKEDAVIDALGHDMVLNKDLSTEATCTGDGRKYMECSRGCGEFTDEVLPATGHDYDVDFTVDTPATCMAPGEKSKHCANCGLIDPATVTPIPQTDHDIITTTIDPTCEEDGKIIKTCSYGCSYHEEEVIKASGRHSVDEVSGKCTVCGVQVCTCLCHKTEWYNQIIYFIVRVWWEFLGIKPVCECGRVHYTGASI